MPLTRILIIGGTSAIGEHVARQFAAARAALYLTGRDNVRLNAIAEDLRIRGAARVTVKRVDLTQVGELDGLVARAVESLGGLDAVLTFAGQLPMQAVANCDSQRLLEAMAINATGAMILLNDAAAFFEQQGYGQLVAVGSVAGDRGRESNYTYGAAKGALEIFMSGLRQRLSKRGIAVLLVKPGFVDTPMTAEFTKGPLWASPERVAEDVVRAMKRRQSVIYTPWFWRWIMLIIRSLPERVFVRLRL
jgi:decaprenylphospho-beta-D-erythro-pentofuranosid-2-ulose 2-reductase